MARTLQTAERRLRIDPNQFIVYYFLCSTCWARHHPSALYDLNSASCTIPGCMGQLYSVKELTDGQIKRTPLRVVPTAPITAMIQLFLLRPGKYEEFQHWRIPGLDDVSHVAPLHEPADPLDAYEDVHWVMGDITDGWGWRAVSWGLERRKVSSVVSRWGVEDVLVEEKVQRFISLPCGLLFSVNIDWYACLIFVHPVTAHQFSSRFSPTKRSRLHSTGAIYVTILNNPRAKRFLPQETILYCVIPGPHEPTLEQLNYITEPLVDELQRLERGESRSMRARRMTDIGCHRGYHARSRGT